MAEYLRTANGLEVIGGTNVYVEQMSQAEYDALPSATKDDNHFRVITDADGEPGIRASEIVSDDGNVQDDINGLQKNNGGTIVDITSYTTSNRYTFPSDGYVYLYLSSTQSDSGTVIVVGANGTQLLSLSCLKSNFYGNFPLYVRKGMKAYCASFTGNAKAYFTPIT